MNKPSKKVIVFLVAIVAVVVIGVLVMLMLPDTGGPEATDTPVSGSTAPTGTESQSPTFTTPDQGTIERAETAEGTIYTVTVPGGYTTYSVTVDASAFDFKGKAEDLLFTSTADQNDFIQFVFSEGAEASLLAPGIMDRYIKYNEFEQSGQNYIPGTEIAGETVAASDGSTSMQAWLIDAEGGVLAVIIRSDVTDTDDETSRLYDVLKSLELAE